MPKCKGLSDSEQALIVENRIGERTAQDRSKRHRGPSLLRPDVGRAGAGQARTWHIFGVRADGSLGQCGCRKTFIPFSDSTQFPYNGKLLDSLDANLSVFPRETAQALEYWLDVSNFSQHRRPPQKLPWHRESFLNDLETYAKRGIRHVTTFACFINAEYVKLYGPPDEALKEYGAGLSRPG